MSTESEPLSHPLRETYSIFLLLTTWASPSQSKHSDACGWAGDCQTSSPAGPRVTRALEGTFRGRMCMWCGKPRTPESTLRSGPNTHRGQLPSIKPETQATAVPYAQNQPALICASQGKRYRAWKITGKKNYCIKGCSIKVNGGIFRLKGQQGAGINDGCHSVIFPSSFQWALISGHTWLLSEVNCRSLPATLVFMGTEDQFWVMQGTLAQVKLICFQFRQRGTAALRYVWGLEPQTETSIKTVPLPSTADAGGMGIH